MNSLAPVTNFMRQKVSLKKKRLVKEGFDLDMAYIGEKLIAMGFPSEGGESVYRNPLSEAKRYLDKFHDHKYMVYNLCAERAYVATKFDNRVRLFPFPDHNAPPLNMIPEFCYSLHVWLSQDAENVAAIHCKAGKGRTGVFICCYLLHTGEFTTAEEVLEYFGRKRTDDGKGVTIPSQRRYVHYYATMMEAPFKPRIPAPPPLWIKGLCIHTLPHGKKDIRVLIEEMGYKEIFKSRPQRIRKQDRQMNMISCDFHKPRRVQRDVKITVLSGKNTLFMFWFNTAFIKDNRITLTKEEIDKACRDRNKIWSNDMKVEVFFMSEQEFDEQKDKEQKQMIERTRSTRFRHALDSEGEDEEPPSEYTSVCTERERKGTETDVGTETEGEFDDADWKNKSGEMIDKEKEDDIIRELSEDEDEEHECGESTWCSRVPSRAENGTAKHIVLRGDGENGQPSAEDEAVPLTSGSPPREGGNTSPAPSPRLATSAGSGVSVASSSSATSNSAHLRSRKPGFGILFGRKRDTGGKTAKEGKDKERTPKEN